MTSFILLCVLVALAVVAWQFYWARLENRLRENPPERVWLKVSLGRGVLDSEKKMNRFLRVFEPHLQASAKQRQLGEGQISVRFIAERKSVEAKPLISTYVVCDREKVDALRAALRVEFGSKLGVSLVDSPLPEYRAPAAAEHVSA
jgi:hypothetical protein